MGVGGVTVYLVLAAPRERQSTSALRTPPLLCVRPERALPVMGAVISKPLVRGQVTPLLSSKAQRWGWET